MFIFNDCSDLIFIHWIQIVVNIVFLDYDVNIFRLEILYFYKHIFYLKYSKPVS